MKTLFFLTCLFAVFLTSCIGSFPSMEVIPTVTTMDTKLSLDYKIVYAADDGFSRDIFVMKTDGSERMNLTEAEGYHGFGDPVWSPDGTKIVYIGSVGFTLNSGPEDNIYVMDADGSNVIQLTNHPGWYGDIVWSPDNRQIAFVSNFDNEINQIFVANADGSNLQQLTKSKDTYSLGSSSPDWSPDGTKIVFNYEYQIAVINRDGSGFRQLTNNIDIRSCDRPVWSPDGTQIVFTAYAQDPEMNMWSRVFAMNADGSHLRQLTEENHAFSPVWSPNGTRIAFKSNKDGNAIAYLWLMNADGTNEIQLANNMSFTDQPVWSPDGSKIIFYAAADEDTDWDVYVINIDGTHQLNLTQKNWFDGEADWRQ